MGEKMRAAVVRSLGGPIVIEEVQVPDPGPGELLVRIIASGVCHTDLHAVRGDWPVKPSPPFILGHEGVGRVAALGAGVDQYKEGDLVGVPWLHSACGHCSYCYTGWETLCTKQRNTGYSVNGSHADYVVADAAFCGRLPDHCEMVEMAPILCAGVTTYKGLKETEARPGEWVVISGIGGLGHLAIQYAKAMGFQVAAVDIAEDKLALAHHLGVDMAIDARDDGMVDSLHKAMDGGAHGVLVTAVNTSAFAQALRMVRSGGTVSLVGLPPGEFPLPIFPVVLNRITVRGSIVGTRQDLTEAIAFAAAGKVRAHVSVAPLESINEVISRMDEGAIEGRVVLAL